MCLTALDKDTPPRWFGGHAALATALGHELTTATGERRDDHRSVDRALRLLHELAFIVRDPEPPPGRGRGRGATYMVVLRESDEEHVRKHLRSVGDSAGYIAFEEALVRRAELVTRR